MLSRTPSPAVLLGAFSKVHPKLVVTVPGGAGGIIYQSQTAAIVHGVIDVFGGEDSRIAFAEKSVVVFGGKCHFLGTREKQTDPYLCKTSASNATQ